MTLMLLAICRRFAMGTKECLEPRVRIQRGLKSELGAAQQKLVAALGVGLASSLRDRNPMTDGFGLIAFASLTPMIFVMAYGGIIKWT